MLTRKMVYHQYGFAGYYNDPYHVLMLRDAYPTAHQGMEVARYYQVPLAAHVQSSGTAGLRPYVGQDPSDPGTWVRPMYPVEGMFARLHEDQRAAAGTRDRKGARRREG